MGKQCKKIELIHHKENNTLKAMYPKVNTQKGITLIALVVTIIILIILASISINMILGEHSLINTAQISAKKARIANYEEALKLIGFGLRPEQVLENLSSKDYMDKYKVAIEKEKTFENSIVTKRNDTTIRVETKEGDIFDITENEIIYVGERGGTLAPPNIEEGIITFENSNDWAKEITVTITTTASNEYAIQYTLDNPDNENSWNNYTNPLNITKNGNIYARLINKLKETSNYTTKVISNIDKLQPNDFTPEIKTTTNSIKVKVRAEDKEATNEDGCSGIAKYYFSKEGGSNYQLVEAQSYGNTEYTFTELTQNTTYQLKVKAVDKAGNETETVEISSQTNTIPVLNQNSQAGQQANVTFMHKPNSWTNQNVQVTISSTLSSSYQLQYATENPQIETSWHDYTNPVTMNNNGNVYARLKDSTNQTGGYATDVVSLIDKVNPSNATITFNQTTTIENTAITATVAQTDANSGISATKCKWVYNTNSNKIGVTESSYTGGTFNNVNQSLTLTTSTAGTYYLHVLSVDNAGNKNETVSNAITVNIGNRAPKITSMTYNTKSTNSITVKAKATDENGDNLTYTLYAGTTTSSMTKKSNPVTVAQGTEVTLTVSGLSQFTDYYYKVEVKDPKNASANKISSNKIKTYCPGTGNTCPGYDWVTCPTCNGNSKVEANCTFYKTNEWIYYINYSFRCGWCGKQVENGKAYFIGYKCNTHGFYFRVWPSKAHSQSPGGVCESCYNNSRNSIYSWINNSNNFGSILHQCPTCAWKNDDEIHFSGYVKQNPCSHNKTTSHQYCIHEKTTQHDT